MLPDFYQWNFTDLAGGWQGDLSPSNDGSQAYLKKNPFVLAKPLMHAQYAAWSRLGAGHLVSPAHKIRTVFFAHSWCTLSVGPSCRESRTRRAAP